MSILLIIYLIGIVIYNIFGLLFIYIMFRTIEGYSGTKTSFKVKVTMMFMCLIYAFIWPIMALRNLFRL